MGQECDADVVIVGGGNAGAALALALDLAGLSAVLVDARPVETRADPDFDGRAYALAAASVKLLGALGVWRGLAPKAQAMTAIAIHDGRPGAPGPERLRFEGAELDEAPFAWLLEDRFLRPALLEAVAARPGLRHLAPADVTAMQADAGGATATLADGTALRARLVVAADGKRSPLARAAGLRWTGRRYGMTGLVCAVACGRPHEGVARQAFYPGGPFAMLPLPGDRVSIVWSERAREAARIAALPDAACLDEIAARAGGLLGEIRLAGRRWAYPLELALAYAYVAPRLALLGDAAHAVHPIAGQGFNLGLRDVAALAEVLAEARRRGEDPGAAEVLARYQEWRRFDSTALGVGMDGLVGLFSSDFGPLRTLRDAGLAAVGAVPALKRAFMGYAAGLGAGAPRMLRGESP
jgi:2-octaprenyl-6-methoxyphenol hydroxylase